MRHKIKQTNIFKPVNCGTLIHIQLPNGTEATIEALGTQKGFSTHPTNIINVYGICSDGNTVELSYYKNRANAFNVDVFKFLPGNSQHYWTRHLMSIPKNYLELYNVAKIAYKQVFGN